MFLQEVQVSCTKDGIKHKIYIVQEMKNLARCTSNLAAYSS